MFSFASIRQSSNLIVENDELFCFQLPLSLKKPILEVLCEGTNVFLK